MQQTQDIKQPHDEDGTLVCPCGADLRFESSGSSMDDTATYRLYECDAGCRWEQCRYAAFPSADGWYKQPAQVAS